MLYLIVLWTLFQEKHDNIKPPYIFQEECFHLAAMDTSDTYTVLLMRFPPYVWVFNHAGEVLHKWGTPGQGPSDLTTVRDVCLVKDEVWVLNMIPNRVTKFSREGIFKSTQKLDDIIWLARLESLGGKPVVEGGGWLSSTHTLFLLDGENKKEIATLKRGAIQRVLIQSGPAMNFEAPFPKRNYWAVYKDMSLVMSMADKGELVLGEDRRWQLIPQTHKVTHKARLEWRKRALPGVDVDRFSSSELVKKVSALPMPSVFPPVLDVLADNERIWVHRAFGDHGQYWECYEDTRRTRRLFLPAGYKVLHFSRNRVFAIDLDHDDFPLMVYPF